MSQRATGSAHCFPLRNANITAVAIFSSTHHRNSHIKTSRSRGIPLMTCTSNPLCGPGREIWELLCLKFHNILSVREHEALVYYVQHLYNPICNIIACAKAGKQKHKAGRSLNTVHWIPSHLSVAFRTVCLKGIPHRKGRTSDCEPLTSGHEHKQTCKIRRRRVWWWSSQKPGMWALGVKNIAPNCSSYSGH